MKKVFLSLLTAAAITIGVQEASAQTPYQTAIGLGIDVGDGPTLVGPQLKHFFNRESAGNVQVLFGGDATFIGADYSYNKPISGAPGLNWYLGIGPQLGFGNGETAFYLRPAAGLEFRIPQAPLALHFDWKPAWYLGDNSDFTAGRFSIGIKFALK